MLDFVERQRQVYFHDFIIYIGGVDVTRFIVNAPTWSIAGLDATNNCSFQIDNAYNRFVLTKENITDGKWREGDGKYSESIKHFIYIIKNDPTFNPTDPVTRARKYQLNVGSCIFHKNDPVLVFVHNPLTYRDEWLQAFSGFLNTKPITDDYIYGASNIDCTAEDIRMIMNRMRVAMNPIWSGAWAGPAAILNDPKEFFSDMIAPSSQGHPFACTKFPQVLDMLITGGGKRWRGVGRMKNGAQAYYNEDGTIKMDYQEGETGKVTASINTNLETWYAMALFGVEADPKTGYYKPRGFLTESQVHNIGKNSYWQGDTAPDNGRLFVLLPTENSGPYTLVEHSVDAHTESYEFSSRLDVLTNFLQIVDYQCYVSGSGDMFIEFPMYDFYPEDYGEFKSVLTVERHLISGTISDEDGEIVTAIIGRGSIPQTDVNPGGDVQRLMFSQMSGSKLLAVRYGPQVEEVSYPFTTDGKAIKGMNLLNLQRKLSLISTISMEFGYRPFILPNKPVEFKLRHRMACTSSVTNTMQLFDQCGTSVDCHYSRQLRDDGKYEVVTGGVTFDASFKIFSPPDRVGLGNTGIQTYPDVDAKP